MRWLREHTKQLVIGAIVLLLFIVMIVSFLNKGKDSPIANFVGNGIGAVQGPVSNLGNGIADGFFWVF